VASVQHRFTKTKRPFITAVLEDLVGSVEVSCWGELYQQTEKLWVEGNILLVQGKVRAKQEGVQLVCDQVHQYPSEVTASIPETAAKASRVLITLVQTEDEKEDRARLYRLLDIIKRYPGRDEVHLSIATQQGLVNLEMPNVTTRYCPEMHQQLIEQTGEGGVTVEPLEGV
jgi:DNA polymerase-3 subunit alpha